jgi:hypothetical protein
MLLLVTIRKGLTERTTYKEVKLKRERFF